MICHVGAGKLIRSRELVGIFDLDGQVTTAVTSAFLKKADRDGITEFSGDDIPRAFVVTRDDDGRDSVILSRLSSTALAKRIGTATPDSF